MPHVLDTNIVRAIRDGHVPVLARLATLQPEEVYVTIVSFEEETKGQNATLNQRLNQVQLLRAYESLLRTHAYFASANVLPYDANAARHDAEVGTLLRRMGTKDRRIAAITRSRGYTLVTHNVVDFRGVPGLVLEDWLAP